MNLLLIRHAKSSWDDMSLEDFDRPLNDRGKNNAPLIGKKILTYDLSIKLIISSPATRAQQTAQLIAKEISYREELIEYENNLYHGGIEDFLEALYPHQEETILMFGHNPGIHSFSYWLCEEPKENLPTCGVVFIKILRDEWTQVEKNSGRLISFDYPKKLL